MIKNIKIKKMKHKWEFEDTCEKCGLKRKFSKSSIDNMVFSKPITLYLVNDEWVLKNPKCKTKQND